MDEQRTLQAHSWPVRRDHHGATRDRVLLRHTDLLGPLRQAGSTRDPRFPRSPPGIPRALGTFAFTDARL